MSRPWMPLYVADYLADTAHLSAAEHGAYLLLIMHYWTKGKLPEDEESIRRVTRLTPRQWSQSRDVLRSFFGDHWCHKRVDAELAKAIEKSKTNSANAKQSHESRKANAEQTHTQPQSPSQKKEVAPDGASPSKVYAFENGVIRLNQRDFDLWQASFSHLDLRAELIALTKWAGEQRSWFNAVSGALAKRNREVKAAKDANGSFKWNGIEGVL